MGQSNSHEEGNGNGRQLQHDHEHDQDHVYEDEEAAVVYQAADADAQHQQMNEPPRHLSPEGAAAANNFGWGSFFGWGNRNHNNPPLIDRRAHPPLASQPPQFPILPRDVTLQQLVSEGLRPDLAFVPFQMARGEVAPEEDEEEAARREAARPTIRCKNPFQIHKSTLKMTPVPTNATTSATSPSPPSAQRPGGPSLPPKPKSSVFTLDFQFESLVPVRVSIHFLSNELVEEAKLSSATSKIRFQPNSNIIASVASSSASPSAPAAGVPSQVFPPGKHTYQMPTESALDVTNLNELQLTYSHRLHYYPAIIQLEEVEQKDEIESSHTTAASSSASAPPRISSLTTYCTLSKQSSSSGGLTIKVVRSAVRISPSGKMFEIQEIYGLKGEGSGSTNSAEEFKSSSPRLDGGTYASPPSVTTSTPLASVPECIVCMSADRDTVIFPCRHMCVCHGCATILKTQTPSRCPVCRFQIEETIFISLPGAQA